MKSAKAIHNQFQKYRQLKESVGDEEQWIREYGYYLVQDESKVNKWYGLVVGPEESQYTGALLLVRISFPDDYPFSPCRVENVLPFPKKFNANLWSADDSQSLMCSDGKYQTFHGLICMDILNTPHSKMVKNSYGEYKEVYDKSKEQYTPIININSIMLSIRSNILNGETLMYHITNDELAYLTLRYLAFGTYLDGFLIRPDERNGLRMFQPHLKTIFQRYLSHYRKEIERISRSDGFSKYANDLTSMLGRIDQKYSPTDP